MARGTVAEVFRVFLFLGLTSFGGPVAHLGYFRAELVERRGWLEDREYADLVALCQFLPGPASSQVGFALGLHRAGILGALAAFVAFTLPSAVLMIGLALGAAALSGVVGAGIITGLKIVAVAIVAHAVLGMSRTLVPDAPRAAMAVLAAASALLIGGSLGQILAIGIGAAGGLWLLRGSAVGAEAAGRGAGATTGAVSAPAGAAGQGADASPAAAARGIRAPFGRGGGIAALGILGVLLVALPLLARATGSGAVALADAHLRAGALVFGGGHVVLPLLEAGLVRPGWASPEAFLAGYGAAQAMPGPLFTVAGYLGAVSSVGPGGAAGGLIALLAIFAPGFLLLLGVLPFWEGLMARPLARAAMAGTNAAVVGILAAALYDPVFTTAITGPAAFVLALACFVLLTSWKLPAWAVVLVGGGGGAVLAVLGWL